ncbi:MAG: PadR family transcriptional regulator [bacterium]|nr:PadR family transcriptional regulator [bacterium]
MSDLSELEGAVLGILWSDGPQTAYAIRTRFRKSPSSHFSGSAGAIYPLVERITKVGLVKAVATSRGKRSSTSYELTENGCMALQNWVVPVKDWMAAVEFDPIRTRVHFLGSLDSDQQDRFLHEAMTKLEAEVKATKKLVSELATSKDNWRTWGARGALAVLQARMEWVRAIIDSLATDGAGTS